MHLCGVIGYLIVWQKHFVSERAGAEIVECACVIELPDLKVCCCHFLFFPFYIKMIIIFASVTWSFFQKL